MKKADKHLATLLADLQFKSNYEVILTKNKEEHFMAFKDKKKIRLVASNARLAIYALFQANLGLAFKQNYQPQIPLRPLMFFGTQWLSLTPAIQVALPEFSASEWPVQVECLCQRALEFGYNALMFVYQEGFSGPHLPCAGNLDQILEIIHGYDLKVIFKPFIQFPKGFSRCPLKKVFKETFGNCLAELKAKYPKIDYLFVESNFESKDFLDDPQAGNLTFKELILEEIQILSKFCSRGLIYYLPSHSAKAEKLSQWILDLVLEIPKNTLIAFSAKEGSPTQDHLPSHPLWKKIEQKNWNGLIPLIPMINMGGIQQGEGLWTLYNLDLIDRYVSKSIRCHFEGIITIVNHLPAHEGFLGLNLWLNTRTMWEPHSKSGILAEKWQQAYHPECDFEAFQPCLQTIRAVSLKLSLIRSAINEPFRDCYTSEECKMMVDAIHSRLQELSFYNAKRANTVFKDSIDFFIRDARNIVAHFAQTFNISVMGQPSEKGFQESFWTSFESSSGLSKKLVFLEKPFCSTTNERMKKVYYQNRLF